MVPIRPHYPHDNRSLYSRSQPTKQITLNSARQTKQYRPIQNRHQQAKRESRLQARENEEVFKDPAFLPAYSNCIHSSILFHISKGDC